VAVGWDLEGKRGFKSPGGGGPAVLDELTPIAQFVKTMMSVESKSSAESTSEAMSEIEDE
jgi:hypothetical protein